MKALTWCLAAEFRFQNSSVAASLENPIILNDTQTLLPKECKGTQGESLCEKVYDNANLEPVLSRLEVSPRMFSDRPLPHTPHRPPCCLRTQPRHLLHGADRVPVHLHI